MEELRQSLSRYYVMYVTAYFLNPVVLSALEESTYLSSLGGSLNRCLEPFRRHVDVTLLRRSACAGVKMGSSFTVAAQHCDPWSRIIAAGLQCRPAASAARAPAHGGLHPSKAHPNLCDRYSQLHSRFPTPLLCIIILEGNEF